MTCVAARFPATVSTASPISIGPCRSASSSMTTPPLRFIAPATPVPIKSSSLAALTMASTSASVMSPRSTTNVVFPILHFMAASRSRKIRAFARLHRFPRPIELFRRCLADRPPPGPHLGLHLLESSGELLGGPSQAVFRVHASQAGHVDHREQQIPELVARRGRRLRPRAPRPASRHLLAHLAPCLLPARPVEAHAGRLDLQALSPEERREAAGTPSRAEPGSILAGGLLVLDLLPLRQRFPGVGDDAVAEDVRMAPGHLGAEPLDARPSIVNSPASAPSWQWNTTWKRRSPSSSTRWSRDALVDGLAGPRRPPR